MNISSLDKEKFQHMHCKITGRPCCIGTQAQCIIASQQYCEFHEGVYHPDKTLCSQVCQKSHEIEHMRCFARFGAICEV